MKLKLQFWKTKKALGITVLETEGLPIKNGKYVNTSYINHVYLADQKLELGISPGIVGSVDYIHTEYAKERINDIVNAITNELFSSVQREVKEGDTVTAGGTTTYIVTKIFPEWYSPRYVLTIPEINKVYLADTIYPVLQRCKFTKDITDTIETYTWEI